MRIKAKKISALFLAIAILMSGFPGMFSGNKVFAQERSKESSAVVNATDLAYTGQFKALTKLPKDKVLKTKKTVTRGTGIDRVKTKITRFEIKHSNGNPISPGEELGYFWRYRLDMDWDANEYGSELKENDYFVITLPKQFKFPTSGPTIDFPLHAPDGQSIVANAHVNSNGKAGGGTVQVTFTKYVEGKDNIRGNLFLDATFAHQNINAGGSNTIVINIGGVSTSVDINIGKKPTLQDEIFTKWGEKVDDNENEARWTLRINHKKGKFSNLTISDRLFVNSGNLPPGIHYIPETFELGEVECDEYGAVKKVIKKYDYEALKNYITLSENNTKFVFGFHKMLGNTEGKQFVMRYRSTYIPQLVLKNEAVFHSHEETKNVQSSFINSQSGGSGQGDLIQKIKIIKIDEDNHEIRLPNAEFLITNVANNSTFTLKTNAQGEAVSNKLPAGKYKIKETKAPAGYALDTTVHEATVVEGEALFWRAMNKKCKISIPVTKAWKDKENQDGKRPDSVTVKLLADGQEVNGKTLTLTEANHWTDTFTDLDEYKNGQKIEYTVKEVGVGNGYTSVINGSAADGFVVTNTREPEKTEVAGSKTWNDKENQDGKRPTEITVNLLKNGKAFKNTTVKPDASGNWKYSFTDLPKYEDGKEIKYTVTENAVSDYTTEITGYNIKNSYTPKETSVTVTKGWDDANDQDGKRPKSIKVQLYGNDEKVGGEVELTDGKWTHTWNDLPEKKGGKTIKYTVKEVGTVAGYTTTYNNENQGNIIICNKHTPETTKVEGEKTWNDADDQDGKRPKEITVNLLKNGKAFKNTTVKPDASGNWKYSFTDLPKYEDGKEIKYTVTENAVSDYTTEITGYNIKNSYTPKETSVTVTKGWDDANDQDGKRPKSIKVQLYGDDKKVGEEVELNEGNAWTHTWTKLPKKAKGKDIKYEVKEVTKVDGYTTEIDNSNIGNIRILNSYTPETTKIKGKKTWNDGDNRDGNRPKEITVNLLANGKKIKESKATADTNWEYSFADLPKYEGGKEIEYTVTENTVKGYSTDIKGYDIKNSYTPKKTSVTVTKRWNDGNDKDKIRPESIKVQLYANGEKKGEAVQLKAENKWTYTWKDLPQKENGRDIKYTVKEVGKLKGYTVKVDDKNHGNIIITNTHTPKDITNPETGDSNRFIPYIVMLLLSVAVITGLITVRRRKV